MKWHIQENPDGVICDVLLSVFESFALLGFDALFLYDREAELFIAEKIVSKRIKVALGENTLFDLINRNSTFSTEVLQRANVWEISTNPYACRLSMNVCINRKEAFYVHIQGVPVCLDFNTKVRFVLLSVQYSALTQANILLKDLLANQVWKYSVPKQSFLPDTVPAFSEVELDILRLSSLGFTEKQIAKIIFKSLPSIKKYKSAMFDRFNVRHIAPLISYARLHHLM